VRSLPARPRAFFTPPAVLTSSLLFFARPLILFTTPLVRTLYMPLQSHGEASLCVSFTVGAQRPERRARARSRRRGPAAGGPFAAPLAGPPAVHPARAPAATGRPAVPASQEARHRHQATTTATTTPTPPRTPPAPARWEGKRHPLSVKREAVLIPPPRMETAQRLWRATRRAIGTRGRRTVLTRRAARHHRSGSKPRCRRGAGRGPPWFLSGSARLRSAVDAAT